MGPRYANATGYSILRGYRKQGLWAIVLFMLIISISMFAVTGAVGAVSAGLLSTMWGFGQISMSVLLAGLLMITALILMVGKFKGLDSFIKLISVLLLLSVMVAFIAVLIKGPIEQAPDFVPNHNILQGAGLVLLVSLVGWMPSGLEASAFHSIWVVEKINVSGYHPTYRENKIDFNIGYYFTAALAVMFLVIGAFTVYGSGVSLEGSSTVFANQLLNIFTANLGSWSYIFIATAAFITIYGTLITAWDAFTRALVRCISIILYSEVDSDDLKDSFSKRYYNYVLMTIGVGGFILFNQFTGSMIKILELATIISFLAAPVICVLNIRSLQSPDIPDTHRLSKATTYFSYFCLVLLTLFTLYYIVNLWQHGIAGH